MPTRKKKVIKSADVVREIAGVVDYKKKFLEWDAKLQKVKKTFHAERLVFARKEKDIENDKNDIARKEDELLEDRKALDVDRSDFEFKKEGARAILTGADNTKKELLAYKKEAEADIDRLAKTKGVDRNIRKKIKKDRAKLDIQKKSIAGKNEKLDEKLQNLADGMNKLSEGKEKLRKLKEKLDKQSEDNKVDAESNRKLAAQLKGK